MRVVAAVLAVALVASGCAAHANERATVTVETLRLSHGADRPLPTLLYRPPSTIPGKHPLILFIHGYTRRPEDHDVLFRHWANAGFVVAAPTMSRTARGSSPLDVEDLINQPADASAVLTEVLKLDFVDVTKVAAAGHSLGGMTVVGLFTKFRDERIHAGIVLAGSARTVGTDYRGTPAEMLFVHGERDTVVPPDQGREAYDACPWPKQWLGLPHGDHLGPYLATSDDYAQVEATTTEFLQRVLHIYTSK